MADKLIYRPVHMGDAEEIGDTLCKLDRTSFAEEFGHLCNLRELARRHVDASLPAHAIVAENEPGRALALVGVIPMSPTRRAGQIWFLASDEIFERHARNLLRASKGYIDDLLHHYYREISNRVDARHEGVVKWLQFMGFTSSEPALEPGCAFAVVKSVIRRN